MKYIIPLPHKLTEQGTKSLMNQKVPRGVIGEKIIYKYDLIL